jgi:hypothetical protein
MYSLKVLDCKIHDDRSWLLCKGNLLDYVANLKDQFYSFSIQRSIVKNQYLDTLITTIQQNDPIPLITLTYKEENFKPNIGSDINIEMERVEILDGLQRTYRLWAHYILIKEFEERNISDSIEFAKQIKRKYPVFFDTGILTLTKIKNFYASSEFSKIKADFRNFDIYFFVWVNLSPKKIIHKMLVLNAGQRSVTKTHQYELLFLYLWEDLQKADLGISLYRERDPEAFKIKNGERNAGDYIFSSVIVGLRSYLEKKPLRITINDLDINELSQDEDSTNINEEIFSADFISSFLKHIKEIDEVVINKEGEEGRKWFVKDTSLSGILAGLGHHLGIHESMPINEIKAITEKGFKELNNRTNTAGFKLNEFKDQYNILSSRSGNIGLFIRRVIMNYTISLLKGEEPSWKQLFITNTSQDTYDR